MTEGRSVQRLFRSFIDNQDERRRRRRRHSWSSGCDHTSKRWVLTRGKYRMGVWDGYRMGVWDGC